MQQLGTSPPEDDDAPLTFDREEVADRRTGEQLRSGQQVTFEVEEDRAVNIRRLAPRGYGA